MTRTPVLSDLVLACALTALGAGLAWALVLGLPLIGIDDAAITRSYAENLALGAGYVYNVGGEHVEGSTAILWVGILTVAYSLTPTPEMLIIALCALFALAAVVLVLRLTRLICAQLGCDPRPAIWTLAVFLLASPGYFMWSVWTMMEVALWSMLLIWLVFLLARMVEEESMPATALGVCIAALLLPLVRPEGIVVAIGLIVLAGLLAPRIWRVAAGATACAMAVFVAVTAFRLSYFGQPFPNTFYAKVSSDRLQDIKDGLKYFFDFLLGSPFADIFVVLWLGIAVWALVGLRRSRRGARAILIVAAAVFGMLSVYAVLGGDHFVLWRFYQPVTPLLSLALAVIVAKAWKAFVQIERAKPVRAGNLAVLAGMAGIVVVGWLQYYQARFDVRKEYRLVEQGLGFGTFLNGVEPRPTIGVGPAGGIALAYDGEILDLLGLNWTEMAHANPVKVGMRNHASFDKPTFWKHAPEVVSAFNRPCTADQSPIFWASNDDAFDGLFSDEEFREAYLPLTFHEGSNCWPGFAMPGWIADVADRSSLNVLDWADVTIRE